MDGWLTRWLGMDLRNELRFERNAYLHTLSSRLADSVHVVSMSRFRPLCPMPQVRLAPRHTSVHTTVDPTNSVLEHARVREHGSSPRASAPCVLIVVVRSDGCEDPSSVDGPARRSFVGDSVAAEAEEERRRRKHVLCAMCYTSRVKSQECTTCLTCVTY